MPPPAQPQTLLPFCHTQLALRASWRLAAPGHQRGRERDFSLALGPTSWLQTTQRNTSHNLGRLCSRALMPCRAKSGSWGRCCPSSMVWSSAAGSSLHGRGSWAQGRCRWVQSNLYHDVQLGFASAKLTAACRHHSTVHVDTVQRLGGLEALRRLGTRPGHSVSRLATASVLRAQGSCGQASSRWYGVCVKPGVCFLHQSWGQHLIRAAHLAVRLTTTRLSPSPRSDHSRLPACSSCSQHLVAVV